MKMKAGCAILAFQRFKSGSSAAFTTDLGTGEDANGMPADFGYDDGQYNQPPFSGGGQSGTNRGLYGFLAAGPGLASSRNHFS